MSSTCRLLAHAEHYGVPDAHYEVEPCPVGFKSTCLYLGLESVGFGDTAEVAKDMSASVALKSLCIPDTMRAEDGAADAHGPRRAVPSAACTNPIGYLNEFAAKNRLLPPLFVESLVGSDFGCVCRFNALEGSGQACSKKAAKKMAAQEVLAKMHPNLYGEVHGPATTSDAESFAANSTVVAKRSVALKNYVGLLQENAAKLRYNLPTYVEESTLGTPHPFIVRCTYRDYSEIGTGKSKKEAKTSAATIVYEKVMNAAQHIVTAMSVNLNSFEGANKELDAKDNAVGPVLPSNTSENKLRPVSSEDNVSSPGSVDVDPIREHLSLLSCEEAKANLENGHKVVGNGETVADRGKVEAGREDAGNCSSEEEEDSPQPINPGELTLNQKAERQAKLLTLFERFNK